MVEILPLSRILIIYRLDSTQKLLGSIEQLIVGIVGPSAAKSPILEPRGLPSGSSIDTKALQVDGAHSVLLRPSQIRLTYFQDPDGKLCGTFIESNEPLRKSLLSSPPSSPEVKTFHREGEEFTVDEEDNDYCGSARETSDSNSKDGEQKHFNRNNWTPRSPSYMNSKTLPGKPQEAELPELPAKTNTITFT